MRSVLAALCLLAPAAHAADIQCIKVDSAYYGYGVRYGKLDICRKSGRYYAGGRLVPTGLVENLRKAVERPPVAAEALSLVSLGMTEEWLRDHGYANAALVDGLIRQSLSERRIDHDGNIILTLTYTDGRKVELYSGRASAICMLPWRVERDFEEAVTYDPVLSRALAALLSENFLNRGALLPDPELLVRELMLR